MLTLTYFTARLNFETFLIFAVFLTLICEHVTMKNYMALLNLALCKQLNDNGRLCVNKIKVCSAMLKQMRVQQCG